MNYFRLNLQTLKHSEVLLLYLTFNKMPEELGDLKEIG